MTYLSCFKTGLNTGVFYFENHPELLEGAKK